MMKKLFVALVFLMFGIANAETYGSITVYGSGFYGSIQTHPDKQYHREIPRYHHYPRRHYVEPPRYPDPVYKSPRYYRERESCYPYPIYDQYGRLMYYQTRCN